MRRNIKGITAVGLTLMMTGALFGCGTADQKADAAETGTEIITEATSEATTEAASETEATTEATTEAATEAASEAATEATDKPEADDSAADEEGKEGMHSKDGVEKGMIEIIGQDRAMWESQGDDAYYTVTDLDHNDRAEIIVATSGGTGHFTYAKIYEVDSTYDGLVACDDGLDEGVPFPDFVIDGNFLTFKDGDKYFYVCSDVYKVSAGEGGETVMSFTFENGSYRQESLANRHCNEDAVTYTEYPSEKEITEDEFNNITNTKFPSDKYTKSETTLKWTQTPDSVSLLECYKAFEGK